MKVYFYGGFHQVDTIEIDVPEEKIKQLLAEDETKTGTIPLPAWGEVVTFEQGKVLGKHFCGIKDCECGGWASKYAPVKAYSIDENGEKDFYN